MAVPTTAGSATRQQALQRLNSTFVGMHANLSAMSAKMALQNITGQELIRTLYQSLLFQIRDIAADKTVNGINALAQDEFNDPALDYVAEATAAQNAAQAVVDDIVATAPDSGAPNNWLHMEKLDPTGAASSDFIEQREFTPAQMAATKVLVDAALATIQAPA